MERNELISVLRALGVSALMTGWLVAAPAASVGATGQSTHPSVSHLSIVCEPDEDTAAGGNGGDGIGGDADAGGGNSTGGNANRNGNRERDTDDVVGRYGHR